ncbi:MAG: phosphatase PAP2 family protein [Ketobacteraceae bacterium]|nr:phosphatase PAP2 family protein [Ketobacteraceae bacterium]
MASRAFLIKQKVSDVDYILSLTANRILQYRSWCRFLHIISRMGDGLFWYALIVSLPLVRPDGGLLYATGMTLTGLVNVAVYKRLKARFARPRPYALYPSIRRGTSVLDEYSFPSGHTLHAVSFTVLLVAFIPLSALLLVPFALLTAASRVMLGVHFTSDVLVGALLGLLHGSLAIMIFNSLQII